MSAIKTAPYMFHVHLDLPLEATLSKPWGHSNWCGIVSVWGTKTLSSLPELQNTIHDIPSTATTDPASGQDKTFEQKVGEKYTNFHDRRLLYERAFLDLCTPSVVSSPPNFFYSSGRFGLVYLKHIKIVDNDHGWMSLALWDQPVYCTTLC